MSRRIKIYSEQLSEVDLATEVVQELGLTTLRFDNKKMCFENTQYDDIENKSIEQAKNLYYEKRKARNIEKIKKALEKKGYQNTTKIEQNKVKIVAYQRIYE